MTIDHNAIKAAFEDWGQGTHNTSTSHVAFGAGYLAGQRALTARVAELEAHLRTIATFGGTLDQARDLAAKGIERAALLVKEKT